MATLALVTAQQEFHTIGIGGRYGKRSEDSQPIYLPDNQLSSKSELIFVVMASFYTFYPIKAINT